MTPDEKRKALVISLIVGLGIAAFIVLLGLMLSAKPGS
jgi:hypothetical protein